MQSPSTTTSTNQNQRQQEPSNVVNTSPNDNDDEHGDIEHSTNDENEVAGTATSPSSSSAPNMDNNNSHNTFYRYMQRYQQQQQQQQNPGHPSPNANNASHLSVFAASSPNTFSGENNSSNMSVFGNMMTSVKNVFDDENASFGQQEMSATFVDGHHHASFARNRSQRRLRRGHSSRHHLHHSSQRNLRHHHQSPEAPTTAKVDDYLESTLLAASSVKNPSLSPPPHPEAGQNEGGGGLHSQQQHHVSFKNNINSTNNKSFNNHRSNRDLLLSRKASTMNPNASFMLNAPFSSPGINVSLQPPIPLYYSSSDEDESSSSSSSEGEDDHHDEEQQQEENEQQVDAIHDEEEEFDIYFKDPATTPFFFESWSCYQRFFVPSPPPANAGSNETKTESTKEQQPEDEKETTSKNPTRNSCYYCSITDFFSPSFYDFINQNRAFIRLCLPSMAIQFLRNFISVIAFAFAGRLLDKRHLAGFIIGFSFTNAVGVAIGMGISCVLDTLCPQAYGHFGPRTTVLGIHLRTTLFIALCYSIIYFFTSYLLGHEVVKLLNPELVDAAQAFLIPSVVQVFGTTCVSSTHKFLNSQHKTHIAFYGYGIGSAVAVATLYYVNANTDYFIVDSSHHDDVTEDDKNQIGQLKLVSILCLVIGFGRLVSGFSMFLLALRDYDIYFNWTGKEHEQEVLERKLRHEIREKNREKRRQLKLQEKLLKEEIVDKLQQQNQNPGEENSGFELDPPASIVTTKNEEPPQKEEKETASTNNRDPNDTVITDLWAESLRWPHLRVFLAHSVHSIISSCANRWTMEILSIYLSSSLFSDLELDTFGTLSTIWVFCFPTAVGCYDAASATVGNAMGAQLTEKARHNAWKSLLWAFWMCSSVFLFYAIFSKRVAYMFVTNEEIISEIQKFALLYGFGCLMDSFQFVMQGIYRSMGKVHIVSKASSIIQFGFTVPCATLLVFYFKVGGVLGCGIPLMLSNLFLFVYYFFELKVMQTCDWEALLL